MWHLRFNAVVTASDIFLPDCKNKAVMSALRLVVTCHSSRRKNTKKMNCNLISTWIRPKETISDEWKQKLKLEDKSLNFLKGDMRLFYNIQIRKVFALTKKHNLLQKCEFVLSKSVTRHIINWENLRQINPERITVQNRELFKTSSKH